MAIKNFADHYSTEKKCGMLADENITVVQDKATDSVMAKCRYFFPNGCYIGYNPNNPNNKLNDFHPPACLLCLEKLVVKS